MDAAIEGRYFTAEEIITRGINVPIDREAGGLGTLHNL
jgi:hypothetical protein